MGKRAQRARRAAAERAYQPRGRNAYHCPICRKYTVTVDVDAGATAGTIACRATTPCVGRAVSLGYPDPWPATIPDTPRWEWYKPDEQALQRMRLGDPHMWVHVRQGGLLLRRIARAPA